MSIVPTFDPKVLAIHRARVNVKSLAEEARIIRNEANRCGRAYHDALTLHRRGRLREEARIAQLALAFLRERPYRTVERMAVAKPCAERLLEKLGRLSVRPTEEQVTQWLA